MSTPLEYTGDSLKELLQHPEIRVVPHMHFIHPDGSAVTCAWRSIPWHFPARGTLTDLLRNDLQDLIEKYQLHASWIHVYKVRWGEQSPSDVRICYAVHQPIERTVITVTLPPIDPIPRAYVEKELKRAGIDITWMTSPVPEHEKDANQLAYALGRLLDAYDRYPNIKATTEAATVFAHETLGHHNARIKKCTKS